MKITQEQFNKAQKTFSKKSLSDTQKHTMLSNIYAEDRETIAKPIVSPLSSYFVFFRQKAFVVIAVVVMLVSGTSYASAQSLPGDLLYGMKVNVIEPIGLALRFSEESKNEYRISLLKKRVDELEKLKERGDIDEDSQKASSEATDKSVKELEDSAIFNRDGENDYVSEKVKIYNNLVDSELKIETTIEIDSGVEMDLQEGADAQKESSGSLDLDLTESDSIEFNGEEEIDTQTEENIRVDDEGNLPVNIDGGTDLETELPGL